MGDYAEIRWLHASRARLRTLLLGCLLSIQAVDETERAPAIDVLHTIINADTGLFDEFVETLRRKPAEASRSAEVLRDLLALIEEHDQPDQPDEPDEPDDSGGD